MHVLRRFREALVPGGIVLDLQVVPPDPVVEVDGEAVCAIDGRCLLDAAAAAAAAVDAMVEAGLLVEEAVDDHDVLTRYATGAELVEDFVDRKRSVPSEAVPLLVAVDRECVIRERCRLRRLRRV